MYVRNKISKLIRQAPKTAGIYAMYERNGDSNAAYVGISSNLRNRLRQHMIRRDSSITTSVSAVRLEPDFIEKICWWTDDEFEDKQILRGVELVAFDVLKPVLRSRGNINHKAKELYNDSNFVERITKKIKEKPTGEIIFPDLKQVLDKVASLEDRVEKLEAKISEDELNN